MSRGTKSTAVWLYGIIIALSLVGYLHLMRRIQVLENKLDKETRIRAVGHGRNIPSSMRPRLPATPPPSPLPAPVVSESKAPKLKKKTKKLTVVRFPILDEFNVLQPEDYEAKKSQQKLAIHLSSPYYSFLDSPHRYDALKDVEITADSYLVNKLPQSAHPTFDKKTDQRYFEKYKYRKPHLCPGKPHECSGRGVCDYSRGVCTCVPPWTGWLCNVEMKPSSEAVTVNAFMQDQCVDQSISAPSAEKWDQRTEERCKNMNDTNGMWLGLTKKMTKTIALSIAETLGVREGSKVLDIGMGCGTLTEYIKQHVDIDMYGIDYSKAAVAYVRERNKKGTFCVADVRDLSFIPSASMDYAFENGVFSVTRDGHCETYKNVMRILKPGGTLLIMQTYTDWHPVKCWQNIRMLSVEGCLKDLGYRFEYILTRDATDGKYDSYCAGETYTALIRKPK